MSIKVMTYVWEHSKHKGSELLMLLAIADHANDDGKAWPSIPRLAERCRVSKRMAIYIIQKLERAGSLTIEHGGGRGHASLYTVNGAMGATHSCKTVQPIAPISERVKPVAPFEKETVQPIAPFVEEKVQSSVIKGATHCTRILRDPSGDKENSLTTFESFPGAVNGVHTPGHRAEAPQDAHATKEPKQKPSPAPISDTDWPGLVTMLATFGLPLAALNDNDWWNDLSYTCNNPTNQWLEREFAKMHAWLRENPTKRPATRWKTFVRGWLERSYEKERKSYASQKVRR